MPATKRVAQVKNRRHLARSIHIPPLTSLQMDSYSFSNCAEEVEIPIDCPNDELIPTHWFNEEFSDFQVPIVLNCNENAPIHALIPTHWFNEEFSDLHVPIVLNCNERAPIHTLQKRAMLRRLPNFKGVRKVKSGKWYSEIRLPNRGKWMFLGSYNTAKDAAKAYDRAALMLYKNKAVLNFPRSRDETSPPLSSIKSLKFSSCSTWEENHGTQYLSWHSSKRIRKNEEEATCPNHKRFISLRRTTHKKSVSSLWKDSFLAKRMSIC